MDQTADNDLPTLLRSTARNVKLDLGSFPRGFPVTDADVLRMGFTLAGCDVSRVEPIASLLHAAGPPPKALVIISMTMGSMATTLVEFKRRNPDTIVVVVTDKMVFTNDLILKRADILVIHPRQYHMMHVKLYACYSGTQADFQSVGSFNWTYAAFLANVGEFGFRSSDTRACMILAALLVSSAFDLDLKL